MASNKVHRSPEFKVTLAAATTAGCLILTANSCGKLKVQHEQNESPPNHTVHHYVPSSDATSPSTKADTCPASEATTATSSNNQLQCHRSDQFRWRTSCPWGDCRQVSVFAHYMLAEEKDDNLTLIVEAFDNPSFYGTPKGVIEAFNFQGKRGSWKQADLKVPPGIYYLRAYATNENQHASPYVFGGMNAVEGHPFGIYGLSSSPGRLEVPPTEQARDIEPVHLFLDKLFVKPGTEPESNARFRLKIKAPVENSIKPGLNVHIQLRRSANFEEDATYDFLMVSDLLLVTGRAGEAEFVTPSLAPADYTIRIWVDSDHNGFADQGEYEGTLHDLNSTLYLKAIANQTRTAEISLQPLP